MQFLLPEFLEEQRKGLAELAEMLRKSRVEGARTAAVQSAARIKALTGRVQELARSGVRLTSISQGAAQRLIELQSDIVTSALDDAAVQLERMAYTENVRDLARMNAEVLQSARQRIVEDIARAMAILKGAAGEAREVAAPARKSVAVKAKKAAPKKKAVRKKARVKTKAKAAPRKAVRRVGRKVSKMARGAGRRRS